MSTSTAVNTFGSIHMGSLMFQNLVSGSTSSLVSNVSNSIGISGGATASLVSEIAVQGALNQRSPQIPSVSYPYIYVNKSGNDSTGNGSLSSPFLTVLAAQNLAGTFYPTMSTIYIAPGLYIEPSPFNIKPNINYIGSGRTVTAIVANLSLGDSAWNDPTGASANRLIVQDVNLQNSTTPGTTLDFHGASASAAIVILQNTGMNGNYTLISSTETVSLTSFFFRNCQTSGTTFVMRGGNVSSINTCILSTNVILTSGVSTSFSGSFLASSFSFAVNGLLAVVGSTTFSPSSVSVVVNSSPLPASLMASTCTFQFR